MAEITSFDLSFSVRNESKHRSINRSELLWSSRVQLSLWVHGGIYVLFEMSGSTDLSKGLELLCLNSPGLSLFVDGGIWVLFEMSGSTDLLRDLELLCSNSLDLLLLIDGRIQFLCSE